MRQRNCRIPMQQFHNLLRHICVRMEPVMSSVPDSINRIKGINLAITPTHNCGTFVNDKGHALLSTLLAINVVDGGRRKILHINTPLRPMAPPWQPLPSQMLFMV
ncbi:hypothetical protein TSUD_167780 [Trifolium subterraneum]|nr:hypothetical protein TSUD_167780 [Trifolium subterraneum]